MNTCKLCGMNYLGNLHECNDCGITTTPIANTNMPTPSSKEMEVKGEDAFCYLVNQRAKRLKPNMDFHERCWAEEQILQEIIKAGQSQEQARIEKEVEKMFNNFHIKTFPHSTESAKELKHQKEIILEVWENMIKPVIQGEVLSIIRNK